MKRTVNSIEMQKILVTVSVLLFALKMIAWYLTASVAILTDALESTVNVVAGFIGLYSIILSAKPRDREHPYGHGKIEFISSAIEGVLISLAGFAIIYKAVEGLLHPHELKQLDEGLILLAITAVINYIVGYLCVKKGRKEHSPILVASGSHLKSDTWSTVGILIGVLLIMLTGLKWIDSAAAFIFALIIIYTGYGIIRRAVSGIMDESDADIVKEIVEVLNRNRVNGGPGALDHVIETGNARLSDPGARVLQTSGRYAWIDVHNMRVINYAGFYHIDCHLTVPYYINVNEAHLVMDSLTEVLRGHFSDRVEFFVHVDGCIFEQCGICNVQNCPVRKMPHVKTIEWTVENVTANKKHVYIG